MTHLQNKLKLWIHLGTVAGGIVFCIFSASAEVFGHYHLRDTGRKQHSIYKLMIMYNAQHEDHARFIYRNKSYNKDLGYSYKFTESLRDNFLIWLRHFVSGYYVYDQVHAMVFVWECKRKVKKDYGFWRSLGSLFTGSKGRALKACQSDIKQLEEYMYRLQKHMSEHSTLMSRVQNSQSRIRAMESRIFLHQGDEYHIMARIQERMNRLHQLQPRFSELTEQQRNIYSAWFSRFKSIMRDSKTSIEDVLESITNTQTEYNYRNPNAPVNMDEDPFFRNLRKVLEDIQTDVKGYFEQYNIDREVRVSSLFEHNPVSFFKENEEQIQELGRLVESYTRVEDIHQFVDQWIKKSSAWLAERKGNTNLLDYFSTETEHFTTLTDKINRLKTIINNELNPQLLMFAHRFIRGTGFFEFDQNLVTMEWDDETRDKEAQDPEGFFTGKALSVSEVRRNIQEGQMSIYISHWLENYYQSYADPSLVDFLNYEANIQNYLNLLEKYITSRHKHKKLHSFAEDTKTFLASNPLYGTSPLMDFLNKMENTLVPITTDDLVLEEKLVKQIQIVRELFSGLKKNITHSYYKTPFVTLMNTFQDQKEDFAQRHQRYQTQVQDQVRANQASVEREKALLNSYIKELAFLWSTEFEKEDKYFERYDNKDHLMKALNNIHPFIFTFRIHRLDYEIDGREEEVLRIFKDSGIQY